MPDIKAFWLDDCEIWAGESLEECLAAARDERGQNCFREEELQSEIDPEQLRTTVLDSPGGMTLESLLAMECAEGGTFPRPICWTLGN